MKMRVRNRDSRPPQALFVDHAAGVVVRPPTFRELCEVDLAEIPLDLLHALSKAIAAEIDTRRPDRKPGIFGSSTLAKKERQAHRVRAREDYDTQGVEWARLEAEHFAAVLDADWSSLFRGGSTERRFYVYLHCEPVPDELTRFAHRNCSINVAGRPFYVGKGAGDRAWNLRRNDGHGAILRQLRRKGALSSEIVHVVADGLTEDEALELESKLFYFFGSRYDRISPGLLVNVDVPASPPIKPMPPRRKN